MISKYKYSYILELEKKYASSFKMCTTNKIAVLPPILKKIGIIYYLLFLVVEEPLSTQSYRPIKRPVGVIMLNKNGTEVEKLYDMLNYEFYPSKVDFEMEYFDINAYPTYWPNRSKENEERFRICLENLFVVAKNTNILKKPNKKDYNNYLSKIQCFFPEAFWKFYEKLEQNDFIEVTPELEFDREKAKLDHITHVLKVASKVREKKEAKRLNFINQIKQEVFCFVKTELVPSLKGKGSYTKLLFFNMLGEKMKDFYSKIECYESCFDPILSESILKKNQEKQIENLKIEAVKIFSRAVKNKLANSLSIDTLSKILIVFLNCLTIEEMQKKIIKIYEDEIEECKMIFEEDIEKIQNKEAREFLEKLFNFLCQDYYETDEDNFSNIFYAYLSTHSIKPNLSLIKIDN